MNDCNIYLYLAPEPIEQTHIRLHLNEQPDQSLLCFPFLLHLSNALLHCKSKLFHFRTMAEFSTLGIVCSLKPSIVGGMMHSVQYDKQTALVSSTASVSLVLLYHYKYP